MEFQFNDGGRMKAGYRKLRVADCVTRAIAIATKKEYKKIYKDLWELAGEAPRNGYSGSLAKKYLSQKGWKYVQVSPQPLRFRADNLPKRKQVIVDCKPKGARNGHYAAVIEGVLQDTWRCDKDGESIIMGYYVRK